MTVVELELSHTVKSVLLWSGELYPGCEREENFPQVSPKSPLVLTPQLQADDSGNIVQELTGCVPNTSPTPPTNPLSVFGSPYSRKCRLVELGQRRLFHDGDEQNKPWTIESAIVQPNDRFESGQEYLATESHSGEIKHPTKLPSSQENMIELGTRFPLQHYVLIFVLNNLR